MCPGVGVVIRKLSHGAEVLRSVANYLLDELLAEVMMDICRRRIVVYYKTYYDEGILFRRNLAWARKAHRGYVKTMEYLIDDKQVNACCLNFVANMNGCKIAVGNFVGPSHGDRGRCHLTATFIISLNGCNKHMHNSSIYTFVTGILLLRHWKS